MGRTSDAKQRLIASGAALIHERGYNAVGVSEVCTHAGVHKGSFYHFFPSKQELGLAVIDGYWAGARADLEALAGGDGSPLARLQGYLKEAYRRHSRACVEHGGKLLGCALGNLALEMSNLDPVLRERISRSFDEHAGYFERVIVEAISRGEVPPQDARRAARSVLAQLEGALMLAKTHEDPECLRLLDHDVLRLLGAPLDRSL